MPIGADVSAQYTEEAVGGGHPTKARVVDRHALVEHHVDGKHKADLLPLDSDGRLVRTSATVLTFERFKGSRHPQIDGSGNLYYLAIPSGGATLGTGGLSASTVYYVYGYDSAGVLTLEASATGYTKHASGLRHKTGDATRTLIGLIRTDGSAQFVNSDTQRFARSWFNGPSKALFRDFNSGSGISTASATAVELSSSNRLEFLVWAGERVTATACMSVTNDDATGSAVMELGLDGASAIAGSLGRQDQHATAGEYVSIVSRAVQEPAEGYHYFTVLGRVITAGNGTFAGELFSIEFSGRA